MSSENQIIYHKAYHRRYCCRLFAAWFLRYLMGVNTLGDIAGNNHLRVYFFRTLSATAGSSRLRRAESAREMFSKTFLFWRIFSSDFPFLCPIKYATATAMAIIANLHSSKIVFILFSILYLPKSVRPNTAFAHFRVG